LSLDTEILSLNNIYDNYSWYYLSNNTPIHLGNSSTALFQGNGYYSCNCFLNGVEQHIQALFEMGETKDYLNVKGHWKWNKLNKQTKEQIKTFYENSDFKAIIKIHNKYKLSDYNYCCDVEGIKLHVAKAIELNLI